MFGGNVRGKVKSVEVPKKLVQSWQTRSPGWPAGQSKPGVNRGNVLITSLQIIMGR